MKRWLGFLLLSLLCFGTAHAEYRAYELEIFDRINDLFEFTCWFE